MSNRLLDDRFFIVELLSALLAAAGQALFTAIAIFQSGGTVFYRVTNGGFYHTEHMNITPQLVTSVAVLILIEIALGLLSWGKKLNLMRVTLPISALVFAGIVSQAFLNPDGLHKHLVTIVFGLIACCGTVILINLPVEKKAFKGVCIAIVPFALFCLGYGTIHQIGGNGSWVFGVQPGEFFKTTLLLLCCIGYHHIRVDKRSKQLFFLAATVMFLSVAGVKDIGNALIMAGIMVVVFLSLGLWKLSLAVTAGGGALGAAAYITLARLMPGNRIVERVSQSLFYPVSHRTDSWANLNIRQAILSLVRGGIAGTGVGGSNSLYSSNVYASHTDFTFACASSIFGFAFGLLVIAALCVLTVNVTVSLKKAKVGHSDLYQANTISCLFLIQTIVHVLGSLSLIPMTGVTLPFISAGGSSMMASFAAAGALLGLYCPDKLRETIGRAYIRIVNPVNILLKELIDRIRNRINRHINRRGGDDFEDQAF